jgi:hypothetical protein
MALPIGMPDSVDDVIVQTRRDGNYGYIPFTPEDSLASSMKEIPLQVLIEYEEGFMKVGMDEAYTVRMLASEFWDLTQQCWEFGPIGPIRRNLDGTVVHGISWDRNEFLAVISEDEKVVPPPKILEERGRGTVIRSLGNQGKVFQYWAWGQLPIEVGILIPNIGWMVEYWMTITLQPIPDDSDPESYPKELQDQALHRLSEISPGVAQQLADMNEFWVITRYLYNGLRVWFCPLATFKAGVKRPLAEEPCSKDKWISWTDLMIFSVPPIDDQDVKEKPKSLFGPEAYLQERYDDPEVQGGKIALIAAKQITVQKPPNGLDRMQSTLLKQIAYNERVLEAEGEIAGINCEVPTFLSELSLDPEEKLIICVNGSVQMKRNKAAIAGQLWVQGDRQMTVASGVLDGMANTKESAVLAAVSEAVTWRPVQDSDGPRKGQRVIIYTKDLPALEAVLSTGDPNIDSSDGHPIAHEVILRESQTYEHPRAFVKEDSEHVINDTFLSEKVSGWMATAQPVATGSHKRVLEDGDHKWDSDEEDDPDMKPDKLTGMYTAGMDPKKGAIKLTKRQVAAQKAAAVASRPPAPEPGPEPQPTPKSSDTEHKSLVEGAKKRLAVPQSPSADGQEGKPATRSRAVAGPSTGKKASGKKASTRTADPTQPTGAKAPPPTKGQESPETKVSTPMVTRNQASRAGGLRPGGGSGQTDTCVAQGNPSKT